MKDSDLDKLCEALTELCDTPEVNPGALYGLRKDFPSEPYSAVSDLYVKVVKDLRDALQDKGVYPENELIEGFDTEQHFQQVALVSQEATSSFIPQIAFAETQVDNILFPICVEGDQEVGGIDEEGEVIGDDNVGDESEEELDEPEKSQKSNKNRIETAISDEEDENASDEENGESDDDLFGFGDAEEDDDQSDEKSSVGGEGSSLLGDENWDTIEGRDGAKEEPQIKLPESSYERSKKRMMEEIRKLEEKQLQEKPWQLKGDVDATLRPVNSLLEEVLEYDLTQRPAPVITEEVTHRLEDVILKRIKDRAFDDVERKVKPLDAPPELKKKIALDQEKSKLSLAEVYEQEYLKQRSKAKADVEGAMPTSVLPESDLTPAEKEINAKLARLFSQLDCLSNFHYAPPPRVAEIEIVANLPAVNVEEVGQDALTSATLLTPGEVAGNLKRDTKGQTEKTKTDKRRERRKKKVHQAKKFQKLQLSTSVRSVQPTPGKGKIKLADPALKSSTSFFAQLESQGKKRVDSNKRQAEEDRKNRFKAKKLKL